MNSQNQSQSYLLGGINSPLSVLSGTGLLVTASLRVDSAVICALALVWINTLTMFAAGAGRKIFPSGGENGDFPAVWAVFSVAASFFCLLFFFVVWIINPLTAMECAFFIALCPVFTAGSGVYGRVAGYDTAEMASQALGEALALGIPVIGAALIREPLGTGAISLPGLGTLRFAAKSPLAVLQASSGALILLGYAAALYRHYRNMHSHKEED